MESNILLYSSDSGEVSVQVRYEDGTFWLTQKRMAELFSVDVRTVNEHLQNIFASGEMSEEGTIRKIRIVQMEGKRKVERNVTFYPLEAIIAVGYRVNSEQATHFRQWATKTLNTFITKGYVLDKKRLKQGEQFGHDYFKELLEDIREIRASERRFYQKITDIYALAIDYDKNAIETKRFFASVQNKLHWAISGQTAAEIIYDNADAERPHMGLTTWRHAPDGKVMKSDITIAKNYLSQKNMVAINRLVSAYLDLAEDRAEQEIPMRMEDWSKLLDGFLTIAGRPILEGTGNVSALEAKLKAEHEYAIFRKRQDAEYISDFDKEIKRLKGDNTDN
ncbi:virulence RhuM family protein [Prevotella sp.]|uniref:virulence RhuM family protein n=1 Tax=Prevotella sp. TaxID=59823 RepID=UPI001CB2E5BE|nr:virulence RhuM family protein [Prevotella sp.]MBF1627987.1 virulence RhuM family protein [Prevotella sp.]